MTSVSPIKIQVAEDSFKYVYPERIVWVKHSDKEGVAVYQEYVGPVKDNEPDGAKITIYFPTKRNCTSTKTGTWKNGALVEDIVQQLARANIPAKMQVGSDRALLGKRRLEEEQVALLKRQKMGAEQHEGYDGELNEEGERHGEGRQVNKKGSVLVGKWENDELVGDVTFTRSSGVSYTGPVKDGLAEGRGKAVYLDGDFEGEFRQGRRERGTLTLNNGDVYIGSFKENLPDGVGTYKTSEYIYQGRFVKGQKHGKGVLVEKNGTRVEGTWIYGKLQGKGNVIFPNGTFKGEFVNDLRQGKGILTLTTESQEGNILKIKTFTYEGDWLEGKKQGKGKGTVKIELFEVTRNERKKSKETIEVYIGDWNHNERSGEGILEIDGELSYEGDWVRNKKHGSGIGYKHNTQYEGNWLNGKRCGPGLLFIDGKLRYNGDWKDNKKEGLGELIAPDSRIYEGTFKDNKREGDFLIHYPNGSLYIGKFKEDKREGWGFFVNKDQSIVKQRYENGQLQESVAPSSAEIIIVKTKLKIPMES